MKGWSHLKWLYSSVWLRISTTSWPIHGTSCGGRSQENYKTCLKNNRIQNSAPLNTEPKTIENIIIIKANIELYTLLGLGSGKFPRTFLWQFFESTMHLICFLSTPDQLAAFESWIRFCGNQTQSSAFRLKSYRCNYSLRFFDFSTPCMNCVVAQENKNPFNQFDV